MARRDSETRLMADEIDSMQFLEEVSTSHSDIVRELRENLLPEATEDDSDDETEDILPDILTPPTTCALCNEELQTNWGFLHHGTDTGYQSHAGYCPQCAELHRPGQPCPTCEKTILAAMPISI